jgi:hypothetical protein
MHPRLLGIIFALGLSPAILPFDGQETSGRSSGGPVPVAATWPFSLEEKIPAIVGELRLRLQVERGVVVRIGVVGQASPALAASGKEALSRWRFAPDVSAVLETTIRHTLAGETGCWPDHNQTIRAQLPDSVEVVSRKFVTICDPALTTVELHEPISILAGHLTCRCASNEAMAGVRLSLLREGRLRGAAIRTVLSDSDGRFRIGGLLPGTYRLEIRDARLQMTDYRFVVATDGRPDPLEISIEPQATTKPVTQVTGGSIPIYPSRARAAGIEGTVNLRVSLRGDDVLDVDAESANQELAAAAVSSVRTWRFRATTVPVVVIRFVYALDQGDCQQARGPVVVMDLPNTVTIRAIGPCIAGRPSDPGPE